MKISKLLVLLCVLSISAVLTTFSQTSSQSVADTSAFELSIADTSTADRRLVWGIGTILNPLFQSNDIYAIPRLYLSVSPIRLQDSPKVRWELEYGFRKNSTSESEPSLVRNNLGKFDTISVETSSQTRINRFGLGLLFRIEEVLPNMYLWFGARGGIMSLNSKKQIQRLGDREYAELQVFCEPTFECEYIFIKKLGVSLQLSSIFNTTYDSERNKYSGSILIPMSVEPITDRINLLLNARWYF